MLGLHQFHVGQSKSAAWVKGASAPTAIAQTNLKSKLRSGEAGTQSSRNSHSTGSPKLAAALGDAIRHVSKKQGVSQERLALLAEIDRSYVGRGERGDNNVAVLTLLKVATALDTTIAQMRLALLTGHDDSRSLGNSLCVANLLAAMVCLQMP